MVAVVPVADLAALAAAQEQRHREFIQLVQKQVNDAILAALDCARRVLSAHTTELNAAVEAAAASAEEGAAAPGTNALLSVPEVRRLHTEMHAAAQTKLDAALAEVALRANSRRGATAGDAFKLTMLLSAAKVKLKAEADALLRSKLATDASQAAQRVARRTEVKALAALGVTSEPEQRDTHAHAVAAARAVSHRRWSAQPVFLTAADEHAAGGLHPSVAAQQKAARDVRSVLRLPTPGDTSVLAALDGTLALTRGEMTVLRACADLLMGVSVVVFPEDVEQMNTIAARHELSHPVTNTSFVPPPPAPPPQALYPAMLPGPSTASKGKGAAPDAQLNIVQQAAADAALAQQAAAQRHSVHLPTEFATAVDIARKYAANVDADGALRSGEKEGLKHVLHTLALAWAAADATGEEALAFHVARPPASPHDVTATFRDAKMRSLFPSAPWTPQRNAGVGGPPPVMHLLGDAPTAAHAADAAARHVAHAALMERLGAFGVRPGDPAAQRAAQRATATTDFRIDTALPMPPPPTLGAYEHGPQLPVGKSSAVPVWLAPPKQADKPPAAEPGAEKPAAATGSRAASPPPGKGGDGKAPALAENKPRGIPPHRADWQDTWAAANHVVHPDEAAAVAAADAWRPPGWPTGPSYDPAHPSSHHYHRILQNREEEARRLAATVSARQQQQAQQGWHPAGGNSRQWRNVPVAGSSAAGFVQGRPSQWGPLQRAAMTGGDLYGQLPAAFAPQQMPTSVFGQPRFGGMQPGQMLHSQWPGGGPDVGQWDVIGAGAGPAGVPDWLLDEGTAIRQPPPAPQYDGSGYPPIEGEQLRPFPPMNVAPRTGAPPPPPRLAHRPLVAPPPKFYEDDDAGDVPNEYGYPAPDPVYDQTQRMPVAPPRPQPQYYNQPDLDANDLALADELRGQSGVRWANSKRLQRNDSYADDGYAQDVASHIFDGGGFGGRRY